jgi:hypothetical protein
VSSSTTASSTVNIARTGGFAGAIDFTLQSAQAGITGAFTPSSSTASSVALVISATAAVPLGSYTVTVSGNGAGVGTRTTTIAVTVAAPPDYTLAATPSTLTINAGSNGTSAIAIVRTGGFTGDVTLALQSPQGGITGVFTPSVANAATASLAVSVLSSVPPGTYTTTVTGTAAGVTNRTIGLTIIVAETPRITLAAAPAALSIAQSSSGTSTLTVTRTNYAAAVSLTASGQPSGVTLAVDPHATLANTYVMTMNVGGAVTPGSYPLTVTATGTGIANAVATVTLTVTAAVVNAEFRYCAAGADLRDVFGVPAWFAYQDGNGAWTRVLPVTESGVVYFRFPITSSVGAVATITQFFVSVRQGPQEFALNASRMSDARRRSRGSLGATRPASVIGTPAANYSTRIDYGTRAELLALGASGGCPSLFLKRNTGSFTGLTAGTFGSVWLGNTSGSAAVTNPNYALDVPLDGLQSLMAGRSAASVYDRFYVRRDVNQPNNGVLPLTDFTDVDRSFAPLERAVTLANGLGDMLNTAAIFRLMPAGQAVFLTNGAQSPTTSRMYRTLPLGPRISGEGDEIYASATRNGVPGTVDNEVRSIYAVPTTQGSDIAITFGARLVAPTITAINGVAPTRVRINGTLPADYGDLTTVTVESVTTFNQLLFSFSAAYRAAVGMGANYEFTAPDLSALPGFLPESNLLRGLVYINVFSDGTTGGPRTSLTPGRVYRSVSRMVEGTY